MPVARRGGVAVVPRRPTSSSVRPAARRPLGTGLAAASSARLFHSPQASQRPDHLACQAPQLPQT